MLRLLRRSSGLALLWLCFALPVSAGMDEPPVPRFASLSSAKVYLRQGPSYGHRILWIYRRKGLPVEVTEQFDVWRHIRLPDGTQGWVHAAMLSVRRTVVASGTSNAPLRAGEDPHAKIVALLEPGVIAKLERCGDDACEVQAGGSDGWIDKNKVWGVSLGKDGP